MPKASQSLISDMFKTISRVGESSHSPHHNTPHHNTYTHLTSVHTNTNSTTSTTSNTLTPTMSTQKSSNKKYKQTTISPIPPSQIQHQNASNAPKISSTHRSTSKTPSSNKLKNPYKKRAKAKKNIQTTINIEHTNDFTWIGTKICRRPNGYVRF